MPSVMSPTSDLLGNSITENWTYDRAENPNGYSSSPSVYSFSLPTGWLGNDFAVLSNDSVNGNWTYTYDNFGRLSAANCNAPYTCAGGNGTQTDYTYAYDPFGNRWQQNVTQGQGFSVQLSFGAWNHINCCGVTYDAAGNMTNDGLGNSYSYDAEGRLMQVGASTDSFIYDAFGRRVSKTEGSYNVQYLYDLQGHQVAAINPTNNQTITTEVYAGGRHWVTDNIAANSAIFLHNDWLGTPHVWTNLNGAIEQTCSNLPFGDGLTCTGGQGNYFSDWHFTGQDYDFGSGEAHFMYRMYGSTDGRWTTPDPSGMASVDPSNPQSWNRYGYVNNNPISSIDIRGLVDDICGDDWDDDSCDDMGGGGGGGGDDGSVPPPPDVSGLPFSTQGPPDLGPPIALSPNDPVSVQPELSLIGVGDPSMNTEYGQFQGNFYQMEFVTSNGSDAVGDFTVTQNVQPDYSTLGSDVLADSTFQQYDTDGIGALAPFPQTGINIQTATYTANTPEGTYPLTTVINQVVVVSGGNVTAAFPAVVQKRARGNFRTAGRTGRVSRRWPVSPLHYFRWYVR